MNFNNRVADFLFIANGELSFLMNSLKGMLENNGFRTDKCDIDMKMLGMIKTFPEVFVTEAEVLLEHSEPRVYLSDLCIEKGLKVVVIGAPDSIKEIEKLLPANVIAQSFVRPINNSEVAAELKKILDGIHTKSKKKKILVVDDSPAFLRLMHEWLDEDYNVSICPSATAAFHMIEANKPDLILLDYEMPICNGGQFLQMLRSEAGTSDIPVMFLTSKSDTATVRSLISLKPQGYLLKNQTKDQTMKAIEEFFIKEMAK